MSHVDAIVASLQPATATSPDVAATPTDALREAAEFARSAIDKHLGDSDPPNYTSDPLFHACQMLSAALRYRAPAQAAPEPTGVRDLILIWRGWANALRLMDSKRSEPQPEAQAQADAYEQCAIELREALTVSLSSTEQHSLPGHEETIDALSSLTIRPNGAGK
jgi:hypothetical protein